jgi:hypothetical protein
MSSVPTTAGVTSTRRPAAPKSFRLSVVPRRPGAQAPRVPFVALVVGLLAAGLVGLLVLNTSMQQGVYVATDLRNQAAQLSIREQNLQVQVAELQSPERLAAVAAASGMVRNDTPAFLSLKTGKVLGVAKPAQAGNSVEVYGGNAAAGSSKVLAMATGSHNSATTGVRRLARTAARGHPSAGAHHSNSRATPRTDRSTR